MEPNEMPLGFRVALVQDPEAAARFVMLSEEKKQEIIAGTRSVKTKEEMRRYVSGIR